MGKPEKLKEDLRRIAEAEVAQWVLNVLEFSSPSPKELEKLVYETYKFTVRKVVKDLLDAGRIRLSEERCLWKEK